MARFTAATAREMAAKAHASRRLRLASGQPSGETFPQMPQAGPQEPANDYVSRRLARVRVQLGLVDKAFETEATKATPDGQRLNWLAQAQERLAEQERILDNRPLPGSRRPKEERGRGPASGAWIELQPALPGLPATTAPQVPKDGPPDPLPVEPPTPAPTAPPTHRPTLPTGLVTIEEALRHRPAPLPAPASPAPPSQKPG